MEIISKFKVDDTVYIIFELADGSIIYSAVFGSEDVDNIFERIERGDYDEK